MTVADAGRILATAVPFIGPSVIVVAMGQRILVVAGEIELRARIGRALLSSGYTVELASDQKRALRLAEDNDFEVAIVAPGSYPASLAMMLKLRMPCLK